MKYQNLLLVFFSIVITLLFIEGFLRITKLGTTSYVRVDPLLGYRFIPGAYYRNTIEGFSSSRINQTGLRDHAYAYTKPANIVGNIF